MEQKKLQAAIEAILFAMGGSVELKKLAQAIGHDEETTKKIIRQMMDRYEKEDRGIRIIELEASFQMCTKKEMYEYLIRVAKQPKKQVLTDVLLETLSIIAYKQPVTKLEIEKIRGVKSDHAVSKLVEYDGDLAIGAFGIVNRIVFLSVKTNTCFNSSFTVIILPDTIYSPLCLRIRQPVSRVPVC